MAHGPSTAWPAPPGSPRGPSRSTRRPRPPAPARRRRNPCREREFRPRPAPLFSAGGARPSPRPPGVLMQRTDGRPAPPLGQGQGRRGGAARRVRARRQRKRRPEPPEVDQGDADDRACARDRRSAAPEAADWGRFGPPPATAATDTTPPPYARRVASACDPRTPPEGVGPAGRFRPAAPARRASGARPRPARAPSARPRPARRAGWRNSPASGRRLGQPRPRDRVGVHLEPIQAAEVGRVAVARHALPARGFVHGGSSFGPVGAIRQSGRGRPGMSSGTGNAGRRDRRTRTLAVLAVDRVDDGPGRAPRAPTRWPAASATRPGQPGGVAQARTEPGGGGQLPSAQTCGRAKSLPFTT